MQHSFPPFFLVGSVRSGTTLLRLLVGHHPQICRCEEMEFVADFLRDNGPDPDMIAYRRYLDCDRNFRASGYTYDESLDFAEQAHDFLRQLREVDGKPLTGAAVHHAFSALPDVWPDARYIYLVRDPRDVARSCVQMGWAGSPWHGAQFWIDAEDEWARLKKRVPEDRRLELRFESLMADSIGTLKKVCTFLGVEYDPAMLEIERDTTYKRPDPNEAKSWKDSAPVDDVQQVECRLGSVRLKGAGYPPSEYPQLVMHAGNRLRISLQDVARRVKFRVRKYGLWLWLSGVISRRLPFEGLRSRVRLRLDEVDDSVLK